MFFYWDAFVLGFIIITILSHLYFKKIIKQLGEISCNRCGYIGLPGQWGNIFNRRIVCPDCKGEQWVKKESHFHGGSTPTGEVGQSFAGGDIHGQEIIPISNFPEITYECVDCCSVFEESEIDDEMICPSCSGLVRGTNHDD